MRAGAAGVIARATKQKLNLKLVFAVADNFCGYDPTSLAASVKSFPAARCQTVNEATTPAPLNGLISRDVSERLRVVAAQRGRHAVRRAHDAPRRVPKASVKHTSDRPAPCNFGSVSDG